MLLSKIGNNAKTDTEKNNSYNSSNNTTVTNNTDDTKIDISENDITKDDKTSKNESNTLTENNKTENTQTELSTYKAVWQYPDSTYPEKEFRVESISDSKVNFDFIIEGITTFENASAAISGNTANFDIKNEGDWNIKGTITFDDNKVIFDIKESSSENIPTGSTTFTVKSNKTAF